MNCHHGAMMSDDQFHNVGLTKQDLVRFLEALAEPPMRVLDSPFPALQVPLGDQKK